ncbi:hypothetical protein F4861DRAFT_284198 [Xylaria intraflava]|nr:hypothetical protein F4861DRAFT_284198 [Xylaria intraflava]
MSEEEIIAVIKEGLRAVAFASLSNGNFCHLTMKDGLLVEHVSGVERIVSSSSRDPPSAVYVTGENQTLIMYADGAGALRAAKFNQHNRGWSQVQAPLCQHPARHNQSRIGAASVLDGAIVFFQRNDGTLHSICFDRASQWYDGFDAPEKGKAGTPIAVFVMPEALAVAFFNVDDELKCHRRNFSSGVWSGNLFTLDQLEARCMLTSILQAISLRKISKMRRIWA